jgi:hypothetical protein
MLNRAIDSPVLSLFGFMSNSKTSLWIDVDELIDAIMLDSLSWKMLRNRPVAPANEAHSMSSNRGDAS